MRTILSNEIYEQIMLINYLISFALIAIKSFIYVIIHSNI